MSFRPVNIVLTSLHGMEARLESLLDDLHREGVEHDAALADRTHRRRNLEPNSARLLHLLALATGARRVLELGTSNGYSTIWLGAAAIANGGGVLSVDVDEGRLREAGENVARAGVETAVETRLEDAGSALSGSAPAQWDMVFLDAERPDYPAFWSDLVRVLRPGGLLAVDNVLSHAEEVADFRILVAADRRVTEALVPTGAGVLLVTKLP
ncbi:MAG TPA: class I SAM-dependent methyltransferase [Solirubrobacterales bacterium]|nr:class I SAM-dependent methyltransferase [Solirubrobacterales bacterium]